MKITDIKTFVVGNPWKNWVFVKVYTDEGLTGIGEATRGLTTKPGEAEVLELSRYAIGEDPLQPGRLWDKIYKGVYLNVNVGISAIDIACWDILAQSLGVPLWKLLGGKLRPKLRVYANGWYKGPREPSAFAERAIALKEMGYTACKFDPFGAAYRFLSPAEETLSQNIVRAVREAVGDDFDICIEGHDRFSVSSAIRIESWLRDYNPMWFEAPVMSTDITSTLEVAKATTVPVASGERFSRLGEFADLLNPRLISIVQPETLHVGGITGVMKACAIAESTETFVACHQAQSPFTTSVNAHVHSAIPNFLIHECFDDFLVPWAHEIMTGVPRVKDGYLEVPDTPGIGVELNEDELAKYPYGENKFLRLFEDGWEQREFTAR